MFNDESFEKKGLMAESFASDYEDAYDEMLDEMGAAALSQYSVSRMLRETDPIAYDVGMNDYESSLLADHQEDPDMYSEMFDEDENLTPTGEKMLKEMYDEMLDESGVEALLNNYDASRLLKETDPIAYRVGLSDYESSMEEDDRNVYRDMAMQRKGMMAETFGAEKSNKKCFICSEPATKYRVGPSKHGKTQPLMGNEEGDLYFCDEHNNLYDFGLFGAGNLLAWTHPNGTKYVQGRLLKNAETFEAEGEPTISYWQLSKGPFNSSEADISVDFEGRKFGGRLSEFDDEGNQVFDADGLVWNVSYTEKGLNGDILTSVDYETKEEAEDLIKSVQMRNRRLRAKDWIHPVMAEKKKQPKYAETFGAESSGLTRLPSDEPNFDPQKADRNKDGKISSWERTVGNKVAKGIREGRKTSSKGIDTFAEPLEEIGISKTYARLGVIAAGITALAIGVKRIRK